MWIGRTQYCICRLYSTYGWACYPLHFWWLNRITIKLQLTGKSRLILNSISLSSRVKGRNFRVSIWRQWLIPSIMHIQNTFIWQLNSPVAKCWFLMKVWTSVHTMFFGGLLYIRVWAFRIHLMTLWHPWASQDNRTFLNFLFFRIGLPVDFFYNLSYISRISKFTKQDC